MSVEDLEAPALKVNPIDSWTQFVKPETAAKLTARQFKSLQDEKAFTVYLKQVIRITLLATMTAGSSVSELATGNPVFDRYVERVMKDIGADLDILNEKTGIVGNLSLPSTVQLAITDLSVPFGVFCFPVIEVDPEYLQTLIDQNLFKTLSLNPDGNF